MLLQSLERKYASTLPLSAHLLAGLFASPCLQEANDSICCSSTVSVSVPAGASDPAMMSFTFSTGTSTSASADVKSVLGSQIPLRVESTSERDSGTCVQLQSAAAEGEGEAEAVGGAFGASSVAVSQENPVDTAAVDGVYDGNVSRSSVEPRKGETEVQQVMQGDRREEKLTETARGGDKGDEGESAAVVSIVDAAIAKVSSLAQEALRDSLLAYYVAVNPDNVSTATLISSVMLRLHNDKSSSHVLSSYYFVNILCIL